MVEVMFPTSRRIVALSSRCTSAPGMVNPKALKRLKFATRVVASLSFPSRFEMMIVAVFEKNREDH